MTVLVAKKYEWFFKEIYPTVKFVESTKNTSTFDCGGVTLEKIKTAISDKGLNPYSLMSW